MTILKLDEIVRKFEETHHQMPAYICLPPVMYEEIGKVLVGYPVERLKMRGVPIRMVRFQRETEVILCGQSFEERYIVNPAGTVIMSEARVSSAASVMVRIAEVYAKYLSESEMTLNSAGISDRDRGELNEDRTIVEHNYAQACTLYELDEGAFIAKYGKYGNPDVSELEVLMGVLFDAGGAQ